MTARGWNLAAWASIAIVFVCLHYEKRARAREAVAIIDVDMDEHRNGDGSEHHTPRREEAEVTYE